MQGKAEDAGGLSPVKDDCAAVGGRLTDAASPLRRQRGHAIPGPLNFSQYF